MRSDYKRIGDYIKEVNNRNKDLTVSNLLGINIDKFFMPSVANIVGTDMSVYKIVKQGQFACNRMHVGRDKRLPVAFSKSEEDFIVSPAYNVFEIIDEKVLLPEYLMMWFSRAEFDRNARFYTDADVRQGLHWDAFCNMKLPVPSISKQQEIIDEYNTIKKRIELNTTLINKLEESAQAVYKQWFVDFEFPDENGNPYKSSGGEMEFCEELGKEVPREWGTIEIKELVGIIDNRGKTPNLNLNKTKYPLIEIGAVKGKTRAINYQNCTKFVNKFQYDNWFRSGHPKEKDILISTVGSLAEMKIFFGDKGSIAQNIVALRPIDNISMYLYQHLSNIKNQILSYEIGSVQSSIKVSQIITHKILIPNVKILEKYEELIYKLSKSIFLYQENICALNGIKDLILSKMASES